MTNKIISNSIVILSLFTLIFFSTTTIYGNQGTKTDNSIVLFLLDVNAIKGDLENQNLVDSLIGITSVLNDNHKLYFSILDSSSSEVTPKGPYLSNNNFQNVYKDIKSVISNHEYQTNISLDINESLLNSYNFLQSEFAGNDSKIILMGGSQIPLLMSNANPEDVLREFVDPVANLYKNKTWKVHGISLKDADKSITILLDRYSERTLSEKFSFSLPNMMKKFSVAISNDFWRLGQLIDLDNLNITEEQLYNSKILIAPGTSETNLFFYKNKTGGSFRLKNPSGMQSSEGDRSESSVTETPYAIVWQIKNPTPGEWSVEINNFEGEIQAFSQSSYEYQIELLNLNQKNAINNPLALIAFVNDKKDLMVNLAGEVSIQLSIMDPNGIETFYEMNDAGFKGDAIKDDGYYSLEIPEINTLGTHKMSLQMTWKGFESASLISNYEFESIFFPNINFEKLNISNLNIGKESNLGTLYVSIGASPYPVDQNSINTTILTDSNQISDSYTLIPRRSTTDGKSAMYDILYTPQEIGNTLITFNMNIDYAGRVYEVPAQNIQIQIVEIPTTFSSLTITIIALVLLISLLVLIVIAAIIYRNLQTHPYGHLHDEKGDLIISFGTIKKTLVQRILHRNIIIGSEIGLSELEGITLKFKDDLVIINVSDDSPTIRIDSQPVVNSSSLENGDWIGTSGRLFEFVTNIKTTN